MRKDEAKPIIVEAIAKMLPYRPYRGADAGHVQFLRLQRERPHLFAWRCSGNQWTHVDTWLKQAGVTKR